MLCINIESMLNSLKAMKTKNIHDERIRVTAIHMLNVALADNNGVAPEGMASAEDLNSFLLCGAPNWFSCNFLHIGVCNVTAKQVIDILNITEDEQKSLCNGNGNPVIACQAFFFGYVLKARKMLQVEKYNHYYC